MKKRLKALTEKGMNVKIVLLNYEERVKEIVSGKETKEKERRP